MRRDAADGEVVRGRRLPGLWSFVMAVVAVGVVWAGVFGVVRAYRYVEDDPSFCRSCHTMRQAWDQWERGEHAGVSCHSCHEPDLAGSLKQVWRYVTRQPDEVEARAEVPASACLSCHGVQGGSVNTSSLDAHHAAGERAGCPVCHGQELHHFETPPWSEVCASCH